MLDTRTPHALVDSEYATRRASCEQAARILGATALRDVVEPRPGSQPARRRGDAAAAYATSSPRTPGCWTPPTCSTQGRLGDLAPLLDASHASMRDDFEITVPTVDLAVETAREAGALGARMTGGGFGGCIIALVRPASRRRSPPRSIVASPTAGYGEPRHFLGVPSAGARRIR